MTRLITQILVLNIIYYSLLSANAVRFSTEDLVDIFANPFKDFLRLSYQPKPSSEIDTKKETKDEDKVTPQTKMIDVPANNIVPCEEGALKDKNGVCRRPW